MLDLETLSTAPNAAVTAIGAVAFNTNTLELHDKPFYRVIDLEDAITPGLDVSGSTLNWWIRQSEAALSMYRLDKSSYVTRKVATSGFLDWAYDLCPKQYLKVWGNGAAFDNVIMRNLINFTLQDNDPWAFWNDRCYRTVKALHPLIEVSRIGVHHNAAEDALTQAEHLLRIFSSHRSITHD